MAVDRLKRIADDLLAHSVEAFAQVGVDAAPARQLVSHGEPAWDCEELVVYMGPLTPKLIGRGDPNMRGVSIVGQAQFGVVLVRCVPTSNADGGPTPTAAQLTASAEKRLIDAWALWTWLTRKWSGKNLFANEDSAMTVTFDSLQPLAPLGGFAGFRLLLTVQIPAFAEAAGA